MPAGDPQARETAIGIIQGQGALAGRCYASAIFTAFGPLPILSGSVSKLTFWPSASSWMPAASRALAWTKTSLGSARRRDEAEPFCGVEEFHSTVLAHRSSLGPRRSARRFADAPQSQCQGGAAPSNARPETGCVCSRPRPSRILTPQRPRAKGDGRRQAKGAGNNRPGKRAASKPRKERAVTTTSPTSWSKSCTKRARN